MSESAETVVAHDPRFVRFGGLRIAFDDRVLRPRPWTEEQSRWAAELLPGLPEGPVLELCAGAGHIGLAAIHGTARRLVCVEADAVAAAYASVNALAAGMSGRTEVREGEMSAVLGDDDRFPLILADPPYLPSEETTRFPADPLRAVDGGRDGLDLVRRCLALLDRHLIQGGVALLQTRDVAQASTAARLVGPGSVATDMRAVEGGGSILRLDAAAPLGTPSPPGEG